MKRALAMRRRCKLSPKPRGFSTLTGAHAPVSVCPPRHLPTPGRLPPPRGVHTATLIVCACRALLADMGKPKKALKLFRKSVEVEPRGSHVKHMYIAQCAVGEEAIR